MFGLLGGILLAGAISGLSFLYLWQGNRIKELTAATQEAQLQFEAAQAINRVLDIRIKEAFSLERIARIGRERLGMSEPNPADIRYVPISIDQSD